MQGKQSSWRRRIFGSVAAFAIGGASTASAQDARWPAHQIIIYVGFAVGGYADSIARLIGAEMSKKLGEPVVIENMDGAGGNVAAHQVASAPNDGYSLLATTSAFAINATLYKKKGFTTGGMIPVAIPAVAPEALSANVKAKINSLNELKTVAKSEKLYLATPGIGSGSQIAQTYFLQKLIKLPFAQIPFSGGGPAMQGLLTGDANLLAATAATQIVSAIETKQIVGLAVASPQRDPAIPDVPTFAEEGYPGLEASSWVGFFAPKGTSSAIVDKLNKTINDILKEPSVRKNFDRFGAEAIQKSTADTSASFNADVARWATMVNSIGLKL